MFTFLVYSYAVDYVLILGTFCTGIIDRYTQPTRTCVIDCKTVQIVNI